MSADDVLGLCERFLIAYQDHDFPVLSTLFSHSPGLEVVGTHERLHLTGWPAVEQSLVKQFEAIEEIRIQIRSRSVHVFADGAAACAFLVVDYSALISGTAISLNGLRATLIWEHTPLAAATAVYWHIVQMHWSVAQPGSLIA